MAETTLNFQKERNVMKTIGKATSAIIIILILLCPTIVFSGTFKTETRVGVSIGVPFNGLFDFEPEKTTIGTVFQVVNNENPVETRQKIYEVEMENHWKNGQTETSRKLVSDKMLEKEGGGKFFAGELGIYWTLFTKEVKVEFLAVIGKKGDFFGQAGPVYSSQNNLGIAGKLGHALNEDNSLEAVIGGVIYLNIDGKPKAIGTTEIRALGALGENVIIEYLDDKENIQYVVVTRPKSPPAPIIQTEPVVQIKPAPINPSPVETSEEEEEEGEPEQGGSQG